MLHYNWLKRCVVMIGLGVAGIICGLWYGGAVQAYDCFNVTSGPSCGVNEVCTGDCAPPGSNFCTHEPKQTVYQYLESHCQENGSQYINCSDTFHSGSTCYTYYKCKEWPIYCPWDPSERLCGPNTTLFTHKGITYADVSDDCPA
jgi:hypothetical protein